MKSTLTPAYWGSLAALVFCLCSALVGTLLVGAPRHAGVLFAKSATEGFILVLLFVLAFTIRYYSATAIDVYGSQATYQLPPGPRKVFFGLFCGLVFLCATCVTVLTSFSIRGAVLICVVASVLSFLSWFGVWLLGQCGVNSQSKAPIMIGVGDLFMGLVAFWVFERLAKGSDDGTIIGLVLATCVVGGVVANEFVRVYIREYHKQLGEVGKALQ